MILFSVYLAVTGLQNNDNEANSLGLASIAILYSTFIYSGL